MALHGTSVTVSHVAPVVLLHMYMFNDRDVKQRAYDVLLSPNMEVLMIGCKQMDDYQRSQIKN